MGLVNSYGMQNNPGVHFEFCLIAFAYLNFYHNFWGIKISKGLQTDVADSDESKHCRLRSMPWVQ